MKNGQIIKKKTKKQELKEKKLKYVMILIIYFFVN